MWYDKKVLDVLSNMAGVVKLSNTKPGAADLQVLPTKG